MNEEEFNNFFTDEQKRKFLVLRGWYLVEGWLTEFGCDDNEYVVITKALADKLPATPTEWFALAEDADEYLSLDSAWEMEIDYFFDDLQGNQYGDNMTDEILVDEIKKLVGGGL